jgi:hypothetical protein
MSFVYQITSSSKRQKTEIRSTVIVYPAIMNGTVEKRKKRIKNLCEYIFELYKGSFVMRREGATGTVYGHFMKKHDLRMNITMIEPTGWVFIAKWEKGRISFEEAIINREQEKR